MSVEQCQRTINNLDKEIADLEKKKATKDKDYATLQGKISITRKSIAKNISMTTFNSKMHQISRWESDAVKVSHAFEDKEDFVDELVAELKQLDLKI